MLAAERRARILTHARRMGAVQFSTLASDLGISPATVRRDIDLLAADGLLVKVRGGATAPNHVDAVDERIHSGPVGVLVPAGKYYYYKIVEGIRSIFSDPVGSRGVNLVLSNENQSRERELIEELLDLGVSGLLLLPKLSPVQESHKYASWIASLPVPVVLLERDLIGISVTGVSSVRTAHDRGAAMAVAYLHSVGHERIGLITRGDTQTSKLIHEGWEAAIVEFGLDPTLPAILSNTMKSWPNWNVEDLDAVLDTIKTENVSAILCHSDEDALPILQRAQSTGWKIPQELSFITYDDEIAAMAQPELTAVAPRKKYLGELAARTLLEHIERPNCPVRTIRIEPHLVVRQSVVPPLH